MEGEEADKIPVGIVYRTAFVPETSIEPATPYIHPQRKPLSVILRVERIIMPALQNFVLEVQ